MWYCGNGFSERYAVNFKSEISEHEPCSSIPTLTKATMCMAHVREAKTLTEIKLI